mgnify:CR=1 FL=1
MKMSALLTRNANARPGVTGNARVDRDIDRLLRRVGPGDIAVLDILDLDRVGANACVLRIEVGLAGADVELPAVPGAADDFT